MSFAFDKYKLSRALEKEGFYEHEKADAFAEIFSEMFSQAFLTMLGNTLASKQDVQGVKEDVRGVREDYRILELRLTAEIEKSRADSDAKHAETQLKIEQARADSDAKHAETQLKIEQARADSDAKHAETQLKIEKLRSEIERSKAETMKWFVGLLLGQAALIATLVKLL